MKKLLERHNTDMSAISDKVWQNGVIVFDTNVLLNLYRYNEETRNELLKLMKSYQNRLWMPYQVALDTLEQELTDFYGLPRKGGIWSRQRQNFIDYLGRGGLQFETVEEARRAAEELT